MGSKEGVLVSEVVIIVMMIVMRKGPIMQSISGTGRAGDSKSSLLTITQVVVAASITQHSQFMHLKCHRNRAGPGPGRDRGGTEAGPRVLANLRYLKLFYPT